MTTKLTDALIRTSDGFIWTICVPSEVELTPEFFVANPRAALEEGSEVVAMLEGMDTSSGKRLWRPHLAVLRDFEAGKKRKLYGLFRIKYDGDSDIIFEDAEPSYRVFKELFGF